MRAAIRAACGLLAALVVAGGARAQGTGGLEVLVVDANGVPLPGASVTLRHEAGFVKPFTAVTGAEGITSFPVLRPGPGYSVDVAMPTFGSRRESDIRISVGDTAKIVIQLSDAVQERIQVIAGQEVVQLERTSSTTKFSDSFVSDLPVPGRFYQNVLTLAPGVQDPDGDGNPTVHGSRSRDFRAEVGGVSNVDPLTGQFMALVNADSIEEMEVVTAGAGVEFGRAQGGFARIIQKQGTNEFEGTFGLLFRSSALDGDGAGDFSNLPTAEFDELHPSAQISGPLLRDRLWYRLSYERLDQEEPINVVGGIEVQEQSQEIQAYQLTWQASPRNKLAYQFQSDPLVISNFGISSAIPPEATQSLEFGTRTHSLTWTTPISPKLLVESLASWQDLESRLYPTTPGLKNDCVLGDPFLENAQCRNLETQETTGSHFLTSERHSQRFTVRSQATLYGGYFAGANHQFKLGMISENERYVRHVERRPNIVYTIVDPADNPAGGTDPEEVYLIAATVAVPARRTAEATGTNWAVYFEDQIKPLSNLVITAGVRVDREEIDSNGMHPFDPAAEGAAYLDALANSPLGIDQILREAFSAYEDLAGFVDGLSTVTGVPQQTLLAAMSPLTLQSEFWTARRFPENIQIANTNFSPALSVSWDPWSSGKNKFAASYRRYHDKIFLDVPAVEVNPATTTLVFDASPTSSGVVEPVGLRDRVTPTVNVDAVERQLVTPYQDEYRLLYERQLWAETLLRVEYLKRKYRDQFQDYDLNHLPGDFGRCRVADLVNPRPIVGSPGAGHTLVDAFTGVPYVDTDPGFGDGRTDDCTGDTFALDGVGDLVERPDGITDLYIQNPAWGRMLLVGNFNDADYEGVVLELVRRQYRGWEMTGSYTWSMARGNGEDFRQFLGLDRSLLDSEQGFQSNDQRHVVKLAATSITPWGVRLGGAVSWQSGLPYSLLNQQLSFDTTPWVYQIDAFRPARERIQYPTGVRNSERNDSQWLVDLKVTKELQLGRGLAMQISAEVFNALNDNTYEVYNPDFETGFQINGRNDARREFGRRWQIGARFAF